MTRIYEIASRYVDNIAALNPVAATAMGIQGHDDEMSDYSPEGYAAFEPLYRDTLTAVVTAPVESQRDRTARDAMIDAIALDLLRLESGEHFRELSIIASPLRALRGVFDLMPRESESDWLNIARRLSLVPGAIAGFQATLSEGLRRGMPAARRQVAENIAQAEVWSGLRPGTKPFFSSLVDAFDQSSLNSTSLRWDIGRAASQATDAFAGFARFLAETYMPDATEQDGVGADRYQLGSRAANGITLDLEETYEWGWEELYRIEREMRETCARVLPGARIDETKRHLESDPARAIEGVDRFLQWMQDLQDRTIAELAGTHFDIPGPIRKIEAMIAPPGGALAMYYTPPSEDFSRPGRTWYPTGGKTRFPLWGEVSIAYHEGVPGHHFQFATTMYLAEELSRFQRLMGGTSGYIEGWALYAERLMAELGYLDNPDYYLGMLRAQAMRAVRVILDIGMHLELRIPGSEEFHPGEKWNAQLGDQFARSRAQFPPDFMASEVTRYLGTPGQAISYKVGERCWLEAREASKRRQGERFDLKEWHRAALNLGPMGLAQMQRELGAV
jgi:uncharacterized protein (DUF885 family)